jgi:hypothetical protein
VGKINFSLFTPHFSDYTEVMKMLKNKKFLIAIGVILAMFSVAVWATSATISWTPSRYAPYSITPGQSTTTTVTFTNNGPSDINGKKLVLEVRGDIVGLVSVTQSFPAIVVPGQSVSVNLAVTSPSNTPMRVVDGTLALLEVVGSGTKDTFSKTLPIEITISPFSIPPEPNQVENDSTLLGVDTDENGVRDDIDRWIAFTQPTSAKARASLTEYAKDVQAFLRDANDKELSIRHSHEDTLSSRCVDYLLGLDVSISLEKQMRVLILNTYLRSEEYLKADGWLGGQIYGGEANKEACSFNPDQLPN